MLEFWSVEEWFEPHGWLDCGKAFDTKEEAEKYMDSLPHFEGYPMRVKKYTIEDYDTGND